MKRSNLVKYVFVGTVCVFLAGCMTVPKGFLRPPSDYLETRQLQMRQYDTRDQEAIISSVAGVLQDLGFTLDSSETKLGLVAASKNADATDARQITLALAADVLSALSGTHSNNMAGCDKEQKVKASVIINTSLDGSKTVIRVTFQRIIWNMQNQISRIETIKDPEIYQKFYISLSKAIFLEAQEI